MVHLGVMGRGSNYLIAHLGVGDWGSDWLMVHLGSGDGGSNWLMVHLGVRDRGQRLVDAGVLGAHGEQGGDPQRHPSGYRVLVQPEADPRHHH